ncbi:hypothetical protein E1287_25670 [Actinomadura sp. KC06]|uniref:hypothetical protein n=1 Tax=Actinomadura sp. KC06 TaxID=2530369 RepID=UPI00105045C2|nr:hypothetical protein [Actinomadura sp. KC06]TDD31652.1 hypothetical protein E1287_25670 [Actinomadura sp. KC06]
MTKATTSKTANCRRCHALLTNPRHVAERITPHCRRKEREEAAQRAARHEAAVTAAVDAVDTTAFKDPQAAKDKAVQLILDEAIVPTRFPGVYLANSSDGVSTYLTDTVENSCTCPAGTRLGRCNHKVAGAALDLLEDNVLGLAA